MSTRNSPKIASRTEWKALSYFNIYRFLIGFLFVALYWLGQLPEPLGVYDRTLFSVTTHIYLILAIIAHFFVHIRKPPLPYQVFGQVIIDIACITLMIYASNGLSSGFGMLLVISVAGGGLLSRGRVGFFYASIATLSVLLHEIYIHLTREFPPINYTHGAFLGVTFFITAIISQILTSRVTASEELAEKRGLDLEKLAKLNEHIVQRLRAGVVVLDNKLRVSLCNEAAARLLGIERDMQEINYDKVLPLQIVETLSNWKTGTGKRSLIFKSEATGADIQVSIVPLQLEQEFEILMFIDDLTIFRQRAQQLKLASLGRLTASIAHEIRNPLGAISHAGQLLSESPSLNNEDIRLTTIIDEHSRRLNQIIENVMGLGRREQAAPVTLELGEWLTDFKQEYESRKNLNPDDIRLKKNKDRIFAKIDSLQLHQILLNLVDNGIRYSKKKPLIEIIYAINEDNQRPYIDIIDKGPGIGKDEETQLFEPFFTTESKGTGLGLYITRELCEANQATLSLYRNTKDGCCFRITFAHPDKQQMVF